MAFILYQGVITAQNDVKSVIDSLKNELSIALEQNASKDRLAELYQTLDAYYNNIDNDSSRYYVEKGLALFEKPDFKNPAYLYLYYDLGNCDFIDGKWNKALSIFKETLHYAKQYQADDADLLIGIYLSMGVTYRRMEMNDSAIYIYKKGIEATEKVQDKSLTATLYYNIGVLHHANKQFKEAVDAADMAMKYAIESDDITAQIAVYSLKGGALSMLKDYKGAVEALEQGIKLGEKVESPYLIMKSLPALISTLQYIDSKDSVRHYLAYGEEIINKLPEQGLGKVAFYEVQGKSYYYLGEYQKSLEACKKLEAYKGQTSSYELNYTMAQDYAKLNNYPQAFKHLNKAYIELDSIKTIESDKEIASLYAKLRLHENQLKIVQLEADKARQKESQLIYTIIYSSVILILVLIIAFMQYKRKMQKKETALIAARKYIDGLESERKRLAKDLHDGICNDLLGIILHVSGHDANDETKTHTVGLLETIRTNVRAISHELMPPSFQFANIDEMFDNYLNSMQKLSKVTISYHAETDSKWEDISENIGYELYRIVQECISNTLKHSQATEIKIKLEYKNKQVHLDYRFNALWETQDNPTNGIGMRTLEDRLKTINGKAEIHKDKNVSGIEIFINNEK